MSPDTTAIVDAIKATNGQLGSIYHLEVVLLLGVAILIVVVLAVWWELRNLNGLTRDSLKSNRENSRSLMAAVHEVAASRARE
jgi:hypothetical protein